MTWPLKEFISLINILIKWNKVELLIQNPIKSLNTLLQSFQIEELNKEKYISYLEQWKRSLEGQVNQLKKKNRRLEKTIWDKDDEIREIKNKYKDKSRETSRKNKNYASLTPNRTITSLDSLSSAAQDMDSILNGLVEESRRPSKKSRRSRKEKSKRGKSKVSRKASRRHKHKNTYYDQDSELSPTAFRNHRFKIK